MGLASFLLSWNTVEFFWKPESLRGYMARNKLYIYLDKQLRTCFRNRFGCYVS